MGTGIVYLLTGAQLAARLVVSIHSLRNWYQGPITVFTTRPESHRIGRMLEEDSHLQVSVRSLGERSGKGYISSYITKTAAVRASPYQVTIFLDADTMVVGSIAELLAAAEASPVVATQFCDWQTTEAHVAERIEKWRHASGETARRLRIYESVDAALKVPLPAINSGVFGIHAHNPMLEDWDALTCEAHDLPMPDELSLQFLLMQYPHRVLGGQFNCHPFAIKVPDVRIWHFAGAAHLQHPLAWSLWLPAYNNCVDLNIGKIASWSRLENPPGVAVIESELANGRRASNASPGNAGV